MSIDTLCQWAPMFADCAQNLHDLPGELLKTHEALTRLDAEIQSNATQRPDPNTTTREVVAATKTAALTGEAWPDAAPIRLTEAAAADHDLRRQTLDRARLELAGELHALIVSSAETLVTDYLRPAHDRLAGTFTEAAKLIPEAPTTDTLMRAPDKVRKAWLGLDDAVTAYGRIRDTAERLNRTAPAQHDMHGEFAMVRNMLEVWPDRRVGRTPPWQQSNDPRLAYLWLARHGADLWLPTSAERDAAWWASHGEDVNRAKHNRQQLEGFRGLLSR